MAEGYPNINFPNISFDWLGNLPKVAEEARLSKVRQSLGDLNLSTPEGLEAGAKKLIAGGALEEGLRMQNAALAFREHKRKVEEGQQYIKALPAALAANRGLYPGAAAPGAAGGGQSYIPNRPAEAPATPDYFNRPVNQPGTLESVIPRPQSTLPGPTTAEAPLESPSNAIITAAQQGQVPPASPGPQLAQAGGPMIVPGPPDVTAASSVPTALPSWLQGAQRQAVPAVGPGPEVTSPAARGTGPAPTTPSNPEIEQKLFLIGDALSRMPPHAQAQRAKLAKDYEDLLRQVQLSPEDRAWQMNNLDRWRRGAQPLNREDYHLMNAVAPEVHKEAVAASKVYEDEAVNSRKLKENLTMLSTIVNHPKFVSGEGTALVTKATSMLSGLRDFAVSMGIPENQLPDIHGIVEPAKLQEAFRSISNLAVINKLGGLGRQISDSDRNYMGAAFPSLTMTKEGNKLSIEIMTKMAERNLEIGKMVRDYRLKHGVRIDAPEIHKLVDDYANEHSLVRNPDGTLNELGQKLQEQMDLSQGGSPAGPPTQAGTFGIPLTDYLPGRGGNAAAPSTLSRLPVPGGQGGSFLRPDLSRARGGPVEAGRPYTVGERGPETFVPRQAGMILPHHEGKVFFHAETGRPAGRIRNGQPVMFGKRR